MPFIPGIVRSVSTMSGSQPLESCASAADASRHAVTAYPSDSNTSRTTSSTAASSSTKSTFGDASRAFVTGAEVEAVRAASDPSALRSLVTPADSTAKAAKPATPAFVFASVGTRGSSISIVAPSCSAIVPPISAITRRSSPVSSPRMSAPMTKSASVLSNSHAMRTKSRPSCAACSTTIRNALGVERSTRSRCAAIAERPSASSTWRSCAGSPRMQPESASIDVVILKEFGAPFRT